MPAIYEGLGIEEIMDVVDVAMRERINPAIAYQDRIGKDRDQSRADRLGIPVKLVDMEPVAPDNFHVGSLPSFVQTYEDRVENYPLIAVTPGRTTPDGEDPRSDQFSVFSNAVTIHSFARAPKMEDKEWQAELAWRRAARMAEAMHQVICSDSTLASVVAGVSGPMFVDRSEPWFYPAEGDDGEDWCWIWIMHTYQVKNYSMKPQEV